MYSKVFQIISAIINIYIGVGGVFAGIVMVTVFGVGAQNLIAYAIVSAIYLPISISALRALKDSDTDGSRKKKLRRNAICCIVAVVLIVLSLTILML